MTDAESTGPGAGFVRLFGKNDTPHAKREALERACMAPVREALRDEFITQGWPLHLLESEAMTAQIREAVRAHVDKLFLQIVD